MSIISKIFGDSNERYAKKLLPIIDQINGLEKDIEKLSDKDLANKTKELKDRLIKGKTLDDILPEAFSCVREAGKRTIGMRHFDVQLIGGITLHQGQIAEMRTGEGKTLVATLPLYLNSLTGKGCHLVTPNDYLSRHGAGWMGPIYSLLGVSVGVLMHDTAFIYDPEFENGQFMDEYAKHLKPCSRKEAYNADITYGTNNEFGFDFLRDNMAQSLDQRAQRGYVFAIVDEVDSILIDEARTPLIISAPAEEGTEMYYQFSKLVKQLKENEDYNVDEKMRAAALTEKGIEKMEKWLGVENIYVEGGIKNVHHIEQALRAETLFKKDRDYIVKEGEVIIIDEFTGRLMQGRRYSEGLHQAIEAKEGVEIQRESQTLATVTFQNYFRMYKKLAGMTGTAKTESEEFGSIYNLGVYQIPTNKPTIRNDRPDMIYKNEEGKYKAVIEEVKKRHETGQPILIGTISIEKNEYMGDLLAREGVECKVLNAKHHEKEALIIADAGKLGAVTVATNMAGRGVDIILGGEPPADKNSQEYKKWQEDSKKVKDLGGLCVIGTERHEARRIDNQLRGRAGRQGDPGVSQFYVSMEDDLMRIFGGEKMKGLMNTLKVPEDMPIQSKMVSSAIENAQHKVELNNYDIRKHLVEYDDVLNKHRDAIYRMREEFIGISESSFAKASEDRGEISNLKEKILEMVEEEIERVVAFHTAVDLEKEWDIKEIYESAASIFEIPADLRKDLEGIRSEAGDKEQDARARTKIIEYLVSLAKQAYNRMEEDAKKITDGEKMFKQVEKAVCLRAIDTLWVEHLSAMSYLRTSIGLRGYGQRDPLMEYKKEAFTMFNQLTDTIHKQIVYGIFKVGVSQNILGKSLMQRPGIRITAPAKTMSESGASQVVSGSKQKVGRNDPCPCGSGKKYKKCCGA